ncbi:Cleavage polyadenylation factor subunit clp1 [Saxophila tyrrhenica]|uniref:Polynucleotide 5'-hydroxyl-kinase GRC3 n=1 Tax=Saxophila tyrrhenica TaxID=1690608 RepID=A0AAV9P132_9PEZI|nr:Cleavage polyadenylation factor subunit clp1 [Saxophila tyrrhenica]
MALPGLSLPGLGLQSSHIASGSNVPNAAAQQTARQEDLAPRTEWRFEVNFQQQYTIRILSGNAELFGVELASNQPYNFSGIKGAIFTWQGCRLEISGEAESEYLGQETDYAVEWLNVHGMLETARDDAQSTPNGDGGPRVLVVGPDYVGKSSLIRSLTAWAVQSGWTPTIVNGDPREGLLAPPGSMSAVTVGSWLSVEDGYGISPISGPTVSPVKAPLVYHCPYTSPTEKPEIYKSLLTRTALSVTNKLEENALAKHSGLIIDTPGALNDPRSNYATVAHIVSEFSISLILTLGSERLSNDLIRRFSGTTAGADAIPVLRITKPAGAAEKDAQFMKQLQNQQIRQYFFGSSKDPLNPHSHTIAFADLNIWRANSRSLTQAMNSSATMDDSDDDYAPTSSMGSSQDFERVTPSQEMLGRLVAIKFCAGSETDEVAIRDSAVMGFAYVSEVDEGKKRVRFLSPHPQRWGDRAMVWGGWPEAVVDLVG